MALFVAAFRRTRPSSDFLWRDFCGANMYMAVHKNISIENDPGNFYWRPSSGAPISWRVIKLRHIKRPTLFLLLLSLFNLHFSLKKTISAIRLALPLS